MAPHAKAAAKDPAQAIVNVNLVIGDWIDVMDAEGTWNVAQVLAIPTPKLVEVRYDGWGQEYDEVVPLNSERVAPYHTYTWSVKCWAKYKNWPWWPSIVTVRPPGTAAGQRYLENESRLFVDFLDRKDFTKRCRCWIEREHVRPFSERNDERRKRSTGTDFENALTSVLQSTAIEKFPTFVSGTLPVQFKTHVTTPAKAMRRECGMAKWAAAFNTSRPRHRGVYMYKSANGADDEDDDAVVQFIPLSDDDDEVPKKTRQKTKAKPSTQIKRERSVAGSNKSGRKPAEDVVKIEDSSAIIEGPHAPSPKREPEEQPLYLPPIDEHLDTGVDLAPEEELAGSNNDPVSTDTATSVNANTAPVASVLTAFDASLEEANRDILEAAPTNEDKASAVNDTGGVAADSREYNTNSAGAKCPPPLQESSKEDLHAAPPAPTNEARVANAGDRALIEDVDENDDDDDDEIDIIPLDVVDDSSVEDHAESASSNTAVTPAVSASMASEPTKAIDTNSAQERHTEQDAKDDETVAAIEGNGALSELKKISDALVATLSLPQSGEVEKSLPPKPNKSKRKAAKSLADECIAETLAVLEGPLVPAKKKRTEKPGTTEFPAPTLKVVQSKKSVGDQSPSTTSKPTAGAIHSSPQEENGSEQGNSDTRRRFSMRAGSKNHDANGQRKSQGKTPVWVLPPPRFDPALGSDAAPWLKTPNFRAPAVPQPFSSLSLFGSTVDFSMTKWFKQDKYPRCLAQ